VLEQDIIKDVVGSQDQIACAIGGINNIEFTTSNTWQVNPLALSSDRILEIEERCYLVYTGLSRSSSEVSAGLISGIKQKEKVLRETMELVDIASSILKSGRSLDDIGELLKIAWRLKKVANPLSGSADIDDFIEKGISKGAIAGKVLGAGGGGFCLFWLRKGERIEFSRQFNYGIPVPIKIDFIGAKVITSDIQFEKGE
jgi:D-glycero-alpha-D-manno-heptose-7-phosphate kinase